MLGTHPVVGILRNAGYTSCEGYIWVHMLQMLDISCEGYTKKCWVHMLLHVYLEMLGTYSVRGIYLGTHPVKCLLEMFK